MIAKYTVHEVEERTKVPASTLRQWERRYGFPMPARSESGYRLYSDHDIGQIDAMRLYIADGVPASRAATLVKNAKKNQNEPKPTQALANALIEALVHLDEARADDVLSEAHALHPVETVLLELIQPAMVEIGSRWHRGQVNTTTEHFASSYVYGKLRGLLSLSSNLQHAPLVIIACAPSDLHELGALMLAVIVRRSGCQVYYVGANTPLEDLKTMAKELEPAVVMISASTLKTTDKLFERKQYLKGIAPLIIFGGMAFDAQPALAEALGGHYLGKDLKLAMPMLHNLIQANKVNN